MTSIRIDLYSDTATRPTPAMREAMAAAEVGDEQQGEDPTINRLVARVGELLGKPDAVFLPSGTMCNQIACRVHCVPGDEIILDDTAHVRHCETGGAAALSGVSLYPLAGTRGVFSADQLAAAIRPAGNHFPRSRAVVVEQTSNFGGGSIWPLDALQAVGDTAHDNGLAVHMDGARLFNAAVAAGVAADRYAACADSVWVDFSKGLGAPVGAVLAGSADFIRRAWRWKHQFGGAMRQAGIIAAGALHALDHHIDRLAEDHANARRLAEGLAQLPGVAVDPVDTNIVFFDVAGARLTAATFQDALRPHGVRVSATGETRLRAVTHLDVSAQMIEEALEVITAVVRAGAEAPT